MKCKTFQVVTAETAFLCLSMFNILRLSITLFEWDGTGLVFDTVLTGRNFSNPENISVEISTVLNAGSPLFTQWIDKIKGIVSGNLQNMRLRRLQKETKERQLEWHNAEKFFDAENVSAETKERQLQWYNTVREAEGKKIIKKGEPMSESHMSSTISGKTT